MKDRNEPLLLRMKKEIRLGCDKSKILLSKISLNEGPIREKYRLVKGQLTQSYK
jgi:hypothetical protein